nr:TrbC/VirB2 family protein [Luteibacter sp. 9135]
MALPSLSNMFAKSKNPVMNFVGTAALMAALMIPSLAFAQIGDTGTKVCGFFQNINSLLNAASIVVVTIAVIFSGYQIAFAHKRIADVAPALIGGVLIGAAAQVAKMVVGGNGSGNGATACTQSSGGTSFLIDAVNTAMHLIQFHA